jgi:hypothetical protein
MRKRKTKQFRFLYLISVTREYGGPEEGGWYYDDVTVLTCVPYNQHERAEREWSECYPSLNTGCDINGRSYTSVLGGPKYLTLATKKPYRPSPRPRYA